VRERLRPIPFIAPRSPEIAERFLRFGPDSVARFGPLSRADDRLEFPARSIKFGGIGGVCRRLRPPERVDQAEPDPTGFIGREFNGASLEIELSRLAIGSFGLETFGLGLQGIVG
jgi:hypothetical protein